MLPGGPSARYTLLHLLDLASVEGEELVPRRAHLGATPRRPRQEALREEPKRVDDGLGLLLVNLVRQWGESFITLRSPGGRILADVLNLRTCPLAH